MACRLGESGCASRHYGSRLHAQLSNKQSSASTFVMSRVIIAEVADAADGGVGPPPSTPHTPLPPPDVIRNTPERRSLRAATATISVNGDAAEISVAADV